MNYNLCIKISRKLLWTGLILFVCGFACSKANAQSSLKIATVDVRRVYDNWTEKQSADTDFEPDRKKLLAAQDNISTARANLEKKRTAMSPEKVKTEEQKIENMMEEFNRNFRGVSEKINKKAEELSTKLDDLLQSAYKDLAEKDGYSIILDSRSVRYSSSDIDITDKVIAYVNKASKPVKKQ